MYMRVPVAGNQQGPAELAGLLLGEGVGETAALCEPPDKEGTMAKVRR